MGIFDMESLIKKTRTIFARSDKDSRRHIAIQSFQEKKRSSSWIRRQSSSRKMSWNYDSSDDDYPTAIAAAAHAIHSIEESKLTNQREAAYRPDRSLNKIKSKGEETGVRKSRLKFSDSRESFDNRETKKGVDNPAPFIKNEISSSDSDKTETSSNKPENLTIKNRTSSSDSDESETNSKKSGNSTTKNKTSSSSSYDSDESEANNSKKPGNPTIEEAPQQAPPMRRPPTFADKHLYIDNSKIPETPEPKPDRGAPANSMAEAWEKEEMASIKERHEALKAIIENWEIKKKKKAERKLERIKDKLDKKKAKTAESYYNERKRATVENWDINKKRELDRKMGKIEEKLDKRRTKAEQSHRNEIKLIEEIAKGAKAQADENRRKEELKVREKADKIRSTGKLPPSCLCF